MRVTALMTSNILFVNVLFPMFSLDLYSFGSVRSNLTLAFLTFRTNITTLIVLSNYSFYVERILYLRLQHFRCIFQTLTEY